VTVIRVDPDKLRSSANAQRSLYEQVAALAARLAELGAAAPSYDGQFGPRVQGITAEGIGRLQALGALLGERAEFLDNKALLFEAADQALEEGLAWTDARVREWIEASEALLGGQRALDWYNRHLALALLARWYLDRGGGNQEEDDDEHDTPWWAVIILLMIRVGGFSFMEEPEVDLSERDQGRLNLWQRRLEAAADGLYFGERTPMAPPEGVEGMLWLNGLTAEQLSAIHQYQLDGSQTTPNDCAVTAMAMAINMAREQLGITGEPVQHGALARLLDQAGAQSELGQRLRLLADGFQPGDIPGLIGGAGEGSGLTVPFRIPAGLQPGEGAMPPGGMEAALNWYAEGHLPEGSGSWTATASSGNNVNDLIRNLQEGNPTILYGVGSSDDGRVQIPHTVVVAGYDASTRMWQILDPGYGPEVQPQPWSTARLEEWWGRKYFAYPRYTIVVLEAEAPSPVAPHPVPQPTPPATTDRPPTLTPAPPLIETPTPSQTEAP
jgi:hypothetical protein